MLLTYTRGGVGVGVGVGLALQAQVTKIRKAPVLSAMLKKEKEKKR